MFQDCTFELLITLFHEFEFALSIFTNSELSKRVKKKVQSVNWAISGVWVHTKYSNNKQHNHKCWPCAHCPCSPRNKKRGPDSFEKFATNQIYYYQFWCRITHRFFLHSVSCSPHFFHEFPNPNLHLHFRFSAKRVKKKVQSVNWAISKKYWGHKQQECDPNAVLGM